MAGKHEFDKNVQKALQLEARNRLKNARALQKAHERREKAARKAAEKKGRHEK